MNFTRSTSETMTSFQATLVNTGFGQLLLRDSLGKVAQKWTLSNPKCVIGTGSNCNVSCQLPGIVDHHALLIIGARQVFIRALASGLTRNGQNVTELVIPSSESGFDFEIAGHHFQYSREAVSTPVTKEFVQETAPARPLFASAYNDAPSITADAPIKAIEKRIEQLTEDGAGDVAVAPPSTLALAPSRLKFTVVRALEKNRQSNSGANTMIDNGLAASRPAWVEAIVRDALRPVEERLDDLNGPLQNLERSLRRQQAQLRKARKASRSATEKLPSQPQIVPVLAPELIQSQTLIEQAVQKQAAQLQNVTINVAQIVARLGDVDHQLTTTQADRHELTLQFQQSNQQIAALQQEMLTLFSGLQTQLAQPAQTETNSQTRLWQSNVEAQLAELQATLLTLDDVKTTLAAAVEQNRLLKGDLEAQQQKLGKSIAESTRNAIADAMALANNSDSIGQLVGDKVCDNLREQLGARFTNDVAQQLTDSLNNEFAQPLGSQLSAQLTAQISTQISTQISSEMSRHLSQLPAPASAVVNHDEIVQAVRATLAEMLTPLAGSLQSSLQSSLQQSIQQAVDQSLQQSVQQTIAPMIEAATAGARAATVVPQFQLPQVSIDSDLPSALVHQPQANLLVQPVVAHAVEPVIEQPQYQPPVQDSQAYSATMDSSQGFDSQPYQSPSYEQPAYEQPVYQQTAYAADNVEPTSKATDDLPGFDSQAYDPQAYAAQEVQAYDSQEYVPDSQLLAYDSQSYQPEVAAAPDANTYDNSNNVQSTPVEADSHAGELPSWWSDEPVAQAPGSGHYKIGGDNDALYREEEHFPAHKNIAAERTPSATEPSEDMDQYAPSAFSAEQLDLDPADEDGQSNRFSVEQYLDEAVEPYATGDEALGAYADSYAPLDDQLPDHELVTAGGPNEYAPEDYQEYPSQANPEDLYSSLSQPEQLTQSAPTSDHPTVAAAETRSGEEGDESVEDYMRRLLARMRGVSENEVTIPGAPAEKPASVVVSKDPSAAKAHTLAVEAASEEQLGEAWTEPFDPDKYVPRGTAPEKNRDLNAMRELANTSARSAIQVSARRRQGSAILIKSAIALVGLIAGVALVSINGARINIAFIATVASFLVAVIWGYDAATSIRPLLQANRQPAHDKRSADKAE